MSQNNCTDCKKYIKPREGKIMLTVVILKTEQEVMFLCEKCLIKFKEQTMDQKVAVEIDPTSLEANLFYCYRCGLKTKDEEYFKKHDCIKTEANIKFAKGLLENKIDN